MLKGDFGRFYRHLQVFMSRSTLGHYRRWLARWAFHLDKRRIGPWEATADDVTEFLLAFRDDYNPETLGHVISSLRGFYQWGVESGRTMSNPWLSARRPRSSRKLPNVIGEDEMARLLSAIRGRTAKELRDRAILYTLYATGCRVSELCDLGLKDLDLEAGRCVVVGKGNKSRIVRLAPVAAQAIREYVEHGRPFLLGEEDDPGFAFISIHGERINRTRVAEVIDRARQRAGLTARVTPHTFRHSFATHLLRNGADLLHVKDLLGHANVGTTQVYIHLCREDLDRAYAKAHPLARLDNLEGGRGGAVRGS